MSLSNPYFSLNKCIFEVKKGALIESWAQNRENTVFRLLVYVCGCVFGWCKIGAEVVISEHYGLTALLPLPNCQRLLLGLVFTARALSAMITQAKAQGVSSVILVAMIKYYLKDRNLH